MVEGEVVGEVVGEVMEEVQDGFARSLALPGERGGRDPTPLVPD